ncbi:MAG: hypothetical protein ABL915_01560 [Gallionella sp.]
MKHAKFFALTSFVLLLSYGALGFYFLPLAGFQGDLTRMALLPESQYGQRQNQPAIEATLFSQATMQDADVLVIGDSFSVDHVWQTELVKQGLKVRTETWDTVRGVCNDFMPWLAAQGFKGKFVVLEIIERNIHDGLQKSLACTAMDTHTNIAADRPRQPPASSFNPDVANRSGRMSIGLQTALNAYHYQQLTDLPAFQSIALDNGATLAKVQNGCALFSHRRCATALFLTGEKMEDLAEEDLVAVAKLNERLTGIKPIWAFVPNKSTSYFYPDKQFWNKAEQRFNAPNLLRANQQAIANKTVDLYPANNTHFSTTGYLLMGEAIYQTIQQAH